MELSRARANQLSTHSNGPSKQEEIKFLLAKLAVRRQAKIAEAEYAVFSEDLLHFKLTDIAEALDTLADQPLADGKTAFPDIGTIKKAVKDVAGARYNRRAFEEIEERRAHKAAHPELYETPEEVKEMAKRIEAKFGFERPKEVAVQPPVMMTCPHCGEVLPVAPNLRFFDPAEMHSLADTLTEVRRLAAANRAADMAAK